MFRRMQQALQKLEDGFDDENSGSETNNEMDRGELIAADEGGQAEGTKGEEKGESETGEEVEGEVEGEEEAGGEELIEGEDEEQDTGEEGEEYEEEGEYTEGEGEEYAEGLEAEDQEAPPGLSRTMSDPVTQTEQDQIEDKKHPPIKIYNPVIDDWLPKHATIDTGCDDDWISESTALQLNIEIVPVEDPPKMTTFSGQPMNPIGQAVVTWEATSTGKTEDTLAYVAENGPFDFLLGANFYWGKDGESYFVEPVEILRMSKKPSGDETSDMKATHTRRAQAGIAAATARQQATKEENTKLRNSIPQKSGEEEEEEEEDT